MAARGTISKNEITQKILSTFDGAFVYNKEIRIPMIENGELVQIKLTLTAASTNVESGADVAIPGNFPSPAPSEPTVVPENIAPTEQEKTNIKAMLNKLNL